MISRVRVYRQRHEPGELRGVSERRVDRAGIHKVV
jgi:hypothetical protein